MDPAASSSSRLNSFIEALDPSISTTEFRFLSEKPHHPRRSRFVVSENLCSVLRIGGGVRDAAKLIITRVATAPIGYVREGDGGCIVDSADHLLGVLSFAGATLQDLQLTGKIAVPQASVPSWTTSLTAHIAALRKLDISGWKCRVHVEDLLDAMSGRVETLTANLSPAGFVAVHGEGIRHLTFNVSGDGFPRDDTKWYRAVKPIGLALESFTAPNLYMCKPAFNFLAGNCPNYEGSLPVLMILT